MKVCETLNFTQAAKELHITQPAVTKHIQSLESEYQTKLFTFSGKHCQLTKNGKELLDLLMTINNDIQHFKSHLNQDRTPINFGATLTIGEYVLKDSLATILSEHPNFQLLLVKQMFHKGQLLAQFQSKLVMAKRPHH
nr:LysR family transcriptional regulator [Streptococcus gallolyticus]